ncbi:MAG: glycogen/starch/alpha-glucan phosphorylase [Lachnospiraceae bacterium]
MVTRTCAYTNHTILAEALEKWPMDYFKKRFPSWCPLSKCWTTRFSQVNLTSHHHRKRSGAHGPYGYPLRLQRQRRGALHTEI